MTPLERRYRRLLRLLPAGYRERREEEMVDTFLLSRHTGDPVDDEVADLTGGPGLREQLSVLRLAISSRLEGEGTMPPGRREVLAGAVRWWVTSGFLVHAALALYAVATLAFSRFDFAGVHLTDQQWLLFGLEALWGRVRVARSLALMALCVGVLQALSSSAVTMLGREPVLWSSLAARWVVVAVDVGLVLGLSAFPPSGPHPQRRGWCAAGGALALVLAACTAAAAVGVVVPVLLDDFAVWSLVCLGGAAVVWGRNRGRPASDEATLQYGLALLCLTTVLLRVWLVVDLVVVDSWSGWTPWLTGSLLLQLLLPAVFGLVALSRASRQARDRVAEPWELEE